MLAREDLNTYWQRVIAIDKIAEFNKHHCSEALKLFLDVDGALRGGGEKVAFLIVLYVHV